MQIKINRKVFFILKHFLPLSSQIQRLAIVLGRKIKDVGVFLCTRHSIHISLFLAAELEHTD